MVSLFNLPASGKANEDRDSGAYWEKGSDGHSIHISTFHFRYSNSSGKVKYTTKMCVYINYHRVASHLQNIIHIMCQLWFDTSSSASCIFMFWVFLMFCFQHHVAWSLTLLPETMLFNTVPSKPLCCLLCFNIYIDIKDENCKLIRKL